MENCLSCHKVIIEAELIDENIGEYCNSCYQDGIFNSDYYLALYYEEKQRLYKRLYKQGYRASHLEQKVIEGLERKQENA